MPETLNKRNKMKTTKQTIVSVSHGTMRSEDLIPRFLDVSVSHGTTRSEDLIPRFLDVLEELDGPGCAAIRQELDDELTALSSGKVSDEQWETLDHLLNETLFDELNAHAAPYFYFGSHPGDGCDYGFWLSEGFEQDFLDNDGLKVKDTSEVPKDYSGEVLHVNDHGNPTLYSADNGKLTEIWSVV